MEILYGSKGIDNFIETTLGEGIIAVDSPHRYRLRILEENDIPGLIRPVVSQLDGKPTLKFNTCSCYVLDRLFLRIKPDGGFLGVIMQQLENLLRRIRAFLLDPDDVVLKPEYMFYNWGEKSLKLLYIPGYGVNIKLQLKSFLEYVMRIFDHRDEAGVRYMYGMYDLICEDTFSIEDFSYNGLPADGSGTQCYSPSLMETPIDIDGVNYDEKQHPEKVSKQSEIKDVVGCTKTGESNKKPITKLVPLTNGALKEIVLSKFDEMILVGRGKRETDYRIPTTQISRVHACIYLRGNDIYVEDRESTNGTFINSVRLEPLKQELINVGDIINFANEEFFAV